MDSSGLTQAKLEGFRWGTTDERDHLEDLSLDGRVILRWMLQKQGEEWTGFIWLSAGKTGGLSLWNDE